MYKPWCPKCEEKSSSFYTGNYGTLNFSPSSSPGTPTEETWPGITTNEEFKTYNFPLYHAEPFVNHAPRYTGAVAVCVAV